MNIEITTTGESQSRAGEGLMRRAACRCKQAAAAGMLIALSSGFSPAAALTLENTFDQDVEGWRITGGELSLGPGYLIVTDEIADDLMTHTSSGYSGDLRAFIGGTLSFDAVLLEDGGFAPWDPFGTVTLVGDSDILELDIAAAPLAREWTTYSAALTPAEFGTGAEYFSNVLGSILDIRVNLEAIDGVAEVVGFDNFRLQSATEVPEPSTLLLLGAGVLGGGIRRRIRRAVSPA